MKRIKKLQTALKKQGLGAMLISKPENVRYLCGFVGTNGQLLVTSKKVTLITDFRYLRSARKQIPRSVAIFDQKDGVAKLLGRYKALGIEEQHLTHARVLALKKALKGTSFKSASGSVERLRMIKHKEEIKVMKKAVRIADQAFEKLLTTVKPGVSEDDLEWNLLRFARELGADGFSFPPIICFGKNTADVHHIKEPNKLKKGEMVLIDMGIEYQGYMTDMTRTFFTAPPTHKQMDIYQTVLEANLMGIRSIEVGLEVGAVDKIARDHIELCGYGDRFGHSTGHGVGLEVHEGPAVAQGSKTLIEPGMVFTVEPGVYLDRLGGVRIEDMVYVNEKGKVEVLTKPSKEMMVL